MRKHGSSRVALVVLALAVAATTPSHAITGTVRVTVAKAGVLSESWYTPPDIGVSKVTGPL